MLTRSKRRLETDDAKSTKARKQAQLLQPAANERLPEGKKRCRRASSVIEPAPHQEREHAGRETHRAKGRRQVQSKNETTQLVQDSIVEDRRFLESMTLQIARLHVKKSSARQGAIDTIKEFLPIMHNPPLDQICFDVLLQSRRHERPAAYFLTSLQARSLFSSNESVVAPVFVSQGARPLFDTGRDAPRPIEQALEYFQNSQECHDLEDPELSPKHNEIQHDGKSVAEIKERFLKNEPSQYPWNFPDIPLPLMGECGTPSFLQSPNCNFLGDMMRYLDDTYGEEICQDSCQLRQPGQLHCLQHFASVEEQLTCAVCFRNWRGALMLAEGGALTHPHRDKFSLGTWISCYEGEIGFAWLSQDERSEFEWHSQTWAQSGKWYYKVLRPGDSMYMPPGTVHQVFRLPNGKQTLGVGGHVIRRPDINLWLSMLLDETAYSKAVAAQHAFREVTSALTQAAAFLIGNQIDPQTFDRYGGARSIRKARRQLLSIQSLIQNKHDEGGQG